ncbi:hypothetical protein RS584_15065 [Enterobacter sp. DTU_2021_1002640_1_SI_PRY_ASU_LCPMC_013]|uniref:hypothetical protein n=1 Tax=Enterobacter sp. DTU_2021_1002640_1_SI_PRY_ASU_LCPMC_013 TaxID=3077940 RepID=UPI0028E2E787|nr:hypothetical protein [Enterobacter sp. DTU_2021_1002640_1_SI_PRY_ASU_LCPMC_013]WNU99028.1 hypothetical protein RS584_15065 [Enterobacter sp. DTU_2021_1002640_1_SI_PRY_ASU_LCPMC_013]
MLVSDVNVNNSASQINYKKSEISTSFSGLFKTKKDEHVDSKPETVSSVDKTLKSDANFKPKFKKEILPSGQEYTSFNVADNLTESDKTYLKSLGWPTATASGVNELANWIAFDRVDGSLTGPVTKDYLLGDKSKGIAGLVDRLQGEGPEFKKLCQMFLHIMDLSTQENLGDLTSLASTLLKTIDQSMKSV